MGWKIGVLFHIFFKKTNRKVGLAKRWCPFGASKPRSFQFNYSGNGIAKWPLPFFVLRSQVLHLSIIFEGSKLDGKDEDSFLFEHGIDMYWLLASTRVDHCECSWYLGLVLSVLKNFWWFALCHPAFSCLISHASLPGEVIKTMVNGKEETRNTAQENDFVVQLGFWKRRLATSMTRHSSTIFNCHVRKKYRYIALNAQRKAYSEGSR